MIYALFLCLNSFFISTNQQPAENCNCCTPEYQQFDFWVGDWEVFDTEGKQVGTNKIERIQGDCALQENWTSTAGNTGTSLNYYNSKSEKWHQVWVDQSGGVLNLSGIFSDNQMVLKSEEFYSKKQDKYYQDKITWTNNEDGTVRQLWQRTIDKGETWMIVFDGLYRKKK